VFLVTLLGVAFDGASVDAELWLDFVMGLLLDVVLDQLLLGLAVFHFQLVHVDGDRAAALGVVTEVFADFLYEEGDQQGHRGHGGAGHGRDG
jgi:hypothetical protein